jgi:hypothetical protein
MNGLTLIAAIANLANPVLVPEAGSHGVNDQIDLFKASRRIGSGFDTLGPIPVFIDDHTVLAWRSDN